MQKQWQTIWRLAGMASLCCTCGSAMGQGLEAPQYPQYVQYPQGVPPVVLGVDVTLTSDQLDGLLAPIALYPDPLLSLMFPAAAFIAAMISMSATGISVPATFMISGRAGTCS